MRTLLTQRPQSAFSAAGGKRIRAPLPPAHKARAADSIKGNCRPRFVYYRGNLVSVINYPLLSERTISTSMLSRAVPFALATVAVTVSPALNFEIMD